MITKPQNRKIYYFILTILPIFILLLIEGILRLSGFGHTYPLFVPVQSKSEYMQPNPEIIQRYFMDSDLAPKIKPDTVYFKKNKPRDSFRIVIQGGSTAAGFPFGRFGSVQGMLQQRFKRLYPEKNIEIISTAMSAVNSYTLLDFVDEIIEIKPDLVLIYAGHNEYLGVMGVGSAFAAKGGRAATLMFLKLKNIRLFQLMQKLVFNIEIFSLKKIPQAQKPPNNRTLMAQVAKEKNIVMGSQLYLDGIEQFSQNLDLILGKYQQAGIHVMLSTLVSNEKNQVPFASTSGEHSANHYFKLGQSLEKRGKYKKAKRAYQEARNRDLLRFRAPGYFNLVIRKKSRQYGMTLVDAEAYIRKDSKHAIIGKKLIYEHLHPNARGYFILSEAFVNKIVVQKLIAKTSSNYSAPLAWKDVPLTKVDRIVADFKIKTLLSDYPFNQKEPIKKLSKSNSFEEAMAIKRLSDGDWLSIQNEMLIHYQKENNWHEAAKISGLIFDAFPDQSKAAYVAGQLYFKKQDNNMALYYYNNALSLEPDNIQFLMTAARAYFVTNKLDEAINLLDKVLIQDKTHTQAIFQHQRLLALKTKL